LIVWKNIEKNANFHSENSFFCILGELYQQMGEWKKAADAYETRLACLNFITSLPSQEAAFTYEDLGKLQNI